MSNKKEEYQEYLESDQWAELRAQAYRRAESKCELCGKQAKAIHHIKYPKNYSEDSLDNLLAVCKRCHMKIHGITEEKLLAEHMKKYKEILEKHAAAHGFEGEGRRRFIAILRDYTRDFAEETLRYINELETLSGR